MAVTILSNAFVSIGGTNISDHVREVTIDDAFEELDNTVMSNTAKNRQAGLPEPSITIKLLQDYAASKTHALLQAAKGTTTSVIVRPDSGATSTTNPQWTLNPAFLGSYTPIGGAVGALQEPTAVFKAAGTVMAYATS